MPNYDLAIKNSYVPHWDVWEGVREIVQNYLDGKDDVYGSQRGTLKHNGSELVLTNEDTTLDRSAWILGETSKASRSDQRGKWGDGLKTGSLALVRAGVSVVFDNGPERWTPNVSPSEQFGGVKTLHVNVRKLRKARSHFQARIGIDRETWNNLIRNFLPLCGNVAKIKVPGEGSILTGPDMSSRIYSRGIFVTVDPEIDYGYDFDDLDLDRDRGRVSSFELKSSVGSMEVAAAAQGDLTAAVMFDRLLSGQESLNHFGDQLRWSRNKGSVAEDIATVFAEKFGEGARPCADEGEATKLTFVGKRGIVIPEELGKVLKIHFGDFNKIRSDAINDSGESVPVEALPEADQAVVNRAIAILELADQVDGVQLRKQLKIWAFDSEDAPLGLYMPDRIAPGVAEIRMNTSELRSLPQFLGTLIHEVAHRSGGDGSIAHRSAEESIWQAVCSVMLDFLGQDFVD